MVLTFNQLLYLSHLLTPYTPARACRSPDKQWAFRARRLCWSYVHMCSFRHKTQHIITKFSSHMSNYTQTFRLGVSGSQTSNWGGHASGPLRSARVQRPQVQCRATLLGEHLFHTYFTLPVLHLFPGYRKVYCYTYMKGVFRHLLGCCFLDNWFTPI